MEQSPRNKYILILSLFAIFMLGTPPVYAKIKFGAPEHQTIQLELADSVLNYADKFLGTRYRRGAASPKGFDCSGFTSYVFAKFGYDLNRSSKGQYFDGDPVRQSLLLPGDLVFFGGSKSKKTVGHVGIVVEVNDDGFQFIHASRSGIRVSKYPQEKYYSNRFIGARRILPIKEEDTQNTFEDMISKIESGVSLLKLSPPISPKKLSLNFDSYFLNSTN